MDRRPGWIVLVAVCAALWAAPARAERVTDGERPAWPGSSLTFLRLGQAVFPGARADGEGNGLFVTTREQVLRQPGTRERATLPEGTRITELEAFTVRGEGRRSLVTLWNAAVSVGHPGETSWILAVFPEGAGEPTDVVSVQTDVFCDIDDGKLLALGPDDGFFIRNHHNNSNQSYLDTGLFHVVDGRLRRVAEVFTLEARLDCAHTFFEALSWRVVPGADGGRPRVGATVRVSPRTDCPGGKTVVRPREYKETYRWDPAGRQYRPEGRHFEGLDKFNTDNL